MRRFIGKTGETKGDTKEEESKRSQVDRGFHLSNIELDKDYLVQNFNDVFIIMNTEGIVNFISSTGQDFFDEKPDNMKGKSLFEFCCDEDSSNMKDMLKLVIKDPSKSASKNISRKSNTGEIEFFEIRMMNYLKEPSIKGIVLNLRNITRRVLLEEKLVYISNHDKITSLPNHEFFQKKLKELCVIGRKERSSFALMMVDVDDFKYINNTLGYSCGDQLIVDIVNKISGVIDGRGSVCRYLGDQFAIIIDKFTDVEDYRAIAKEIIEIFNEPFIVDKYEVYITASIGIGVFAEDGSDSLTLEKNANKALYYAKSGGRNNYKFYSAGGDISGFKHFELRNDLYKAIEKNQLACYFQPIVNIKNGTILAAEALIRWSHPTWGIVSANEFINLAEDSGLIIDLGKWILREVCKNYSQWLKRGFSKIQIHINYSSVQFFEKDFIENIKEIINEYRLDPNFLIIELTESVLTFGDSSMIENIKTLQNMGIKVAIDDFGMGISSFNYLNSFNVDILKLDKSFIKDIPNNVKSSKILQSLVNLAIDLDLKLIVTGIENWQQLSYLRGMNCHSGQGYAFSKALPTKQFERVLSKKIIRPIRQSVDTEFVEKRRFFRIDFMNLLEGEMTILEIGGKGVNAGSTNILIKNIGPGGLCMVTNVQLPIKKDIILCFTTELLERNIDLKGNLVWTSEIDERLSEYGVEFIVDENQRTELIKLLNTVQIRMRNNIMFAEGSFISDTMFKYFDDVKS